MSKIEWSLCLVTLKTIPSLKMLHLKMKLSQIIPVFLLDGLAVLFVYLGLQHKNNADSMRTTETHEAFVEGQKALVESHEQYALLYFIGAAVCFILGALFILKWAKQRKKQMETKDDWSDVQ